jgi:hypothetical protein
MYVYFKLYKIVVFSLRVYWNEIPTCDNEGSIKIKYYSQI